MRIGIDISQIVYSGTGVANYTRNLIKSLLEIDQKNQYILFFSSLRRKLNYPFINELTSSRVKIKHFRFPPKLLDILWNELHICPIEWFIGQVDVFLSSDWIQPPAVRTKKVTTVHDLTPWKFPSETHPKIVSVHKRRMRWVKKECDLIICDSEATKNDLIEIVGLPEEKVRVVYLGK